MSDEATAHRTAAVIPAAGRGVRLGPGAPKALRTLGGTPMLIHAVRAMAASRAVSLVVVVAPPDGALEVKNLLDEHALPERTDYLVVPGGRHPPGVRTHRPRSPPRRHHHRPRPRRGPPPRARRHRRRRRRSRPRRRAGGRPRAAPRRHRQAGRATGAGRARTGGRHPDRALLRAVQTPQGFDRATLRHAPRNGPPRRGGCDGLRRHGGELGVPVVVVPGHEEAFKVTRPLDLVLAEAVLARRRANDGF